MDDLATTAAHPRPGSVHRASDFVQTGKRPIYETVVNPKFCAPPIPGESGVLERRDHLANPVRCEVSIPIHPRGPDAGRTGDGGEGRALRV